MHNILSKMFLFLFMFFAMQLLCSFFRFKELFQAGAHPFDGLLFQVKNGLTKLLLFCFENAKILGQSDDAKRRKKRGWPYEEKR